MRRPLHPRRLLAAIAVVFGGAALLAALAHGWGERRELHAQAAQSQRQLALQGRALAQLIDRYRALPQLLALDPDLRAGVSGPVDAARRQALNLRLEQANRTTQASTLTLIDARGMAVAASNWREAGSNVGAHYGFRPYVQQAMQAGEGRFYGIGVTTGVPGYFLSETVRDVAGRAIGVVVIKIELSALEREWLQAGDDILVSDRNGVVFLANHDDWRYRSLAPLSPAALREMADARQYGNQPLRPAHMQPLRDDAHAALVRVQTPARPGARLWMQAPVDDTDWHLHLLRDVDAALAAAGRQAAIGAALAWMALSLLVLLVFQRRRLAALRQRNRAELEALVRQHARELRTARDGLLEAAAQADTGLSRQLEHLPQGVVIIDAHLCIVAWNRRYLELFRFPPGFVTVGRPIEDVFRYNAERGLLGPGPIEEAIARRLGHLRSGAPHARESEKADGTVLEIRGNPLPDGGFVTSYADITGYKNTARELRTLADALERRIARRTADLEQARRAAVEANRYKTRFVAAAVHDLLQPLNAARMFLSTLHTRLADPAQRTVAGHVEAALAAQDAILTSLLDIARMEAGSLQVNLQDMPLAPLLDALTREFGLQARQRGLHLHQVPTTVHVRSDPDLLRRILQNLLSNAVRYTKRGRILIVCRRDGDGVRIEVRDSGPGIPRARQREIFEEFRRLDDADDTRGAGLGLAIVERIARLLGHRIGLRSQPGRGSVFWLRVPRATPPQAAAPQIAAPAPQAPSDGQASPLQGQAIWYLDADPDRRAAVQALLLRWGCQPTLLADARAAAAAASPGQAPAVVLIATAPGSDDPAHCYDALAARWGSQPPAVLLAAAEDTDARALAATRQWPVLAQPPRAPALRALISQLLLRGR